MKPGIPKSCAVGSNWNVMAHADAREGNWRGNWRMEWVASTLHTTSEHGVSSITSADAHTSAVSSRLNWRLCRFKWTRPFRRKTKSGFCACAITFQTQSTIKIIFLEPRVCECFYGSVTRRKGKIFSGSDHYFIKKCKGTEVRGLFQVGLLYPWGKALGLPWVRDRVDLTVCLSVGVC